MLSFDKKKPCQKELFFFFSGVYDDALCPVDSKYVGKLYKYLLTMFMKG